MSSSSGMIQLQDLLSDEANNRCFDCNAEGPTWASLSHGTFICLSCSSIHRSLGLQISFVKSVTMDSWSARQLMYMKNGGNARLKEFFDAYNVSDMPAAVKYTTVAAAHYRRQLRSIVDGTPLPHPLDKSIAANIDQVSQKPPRLSKGISKGFTKVKEDGGVCQSEGKHPSLKSLAQKNPKEFFNSLGNMMGSLIQETYSKAEKAVTGVNVNTLVSNAVGALETSKSWIEEKGKSLAVNVQNPEWWELNHEKAKIGAAQVASTLTTVAMNTQDWIKKKVTAECDCTDDPRKRENLFAHEYQQYQQETRGQPVGVNSGAKIWNEPSESAEGSTLDPQ